MLRLPLLACVSSFLLVTPAFAGLLSSTPGTQKVEDVPVSPEAKAKSGNRSHSLKLVGAGLRYKKVALFKAKVYVGELFLDAPDKFVKTADGALDSLEKQKAIAIRMTFLRDVGAEKISDGFKDGLKENKVSLDSEAVKSFLEIVKQGGDVKEKSTLTLLGEKLAGGKEMVTYEASSGKQFTVSGETGLLKMVFSIWLGKMDDSGLESLRDEWLGLKN